MAVNGCVPSTVEPQLAASEVSAMGASYTNVQVQLAGRPVNGIRLQIIEALRRWVLTGSFVESIPDDPDDELGSLVELARILPTSGSFDTDIAIRCA